MQIGRKIYYDKLSGNVIYDTGEMSGDVIETTIEEDFATYTPLINREPETVGCLRVPYGQDREKFIQYLFHVDPVTGEIVWDLTPPQQEEEHRNLTLEEQIGQLQAENASLREQLAATNRDLQDIAEYVFSA